MYGDDIFPTKVRSVTNGFMSVVVAMHFQGPKDQGQ